MLGVVRVPVRPLARVSSVPRLDRVRRRRRCPLRLLRGVRIEREGKYSEERVSLCVVDNGNAGSVIRCRVQAFDC